MPTSEFDKVMAEEWRVAGDVCVVWVDRLSDGHCVHAAEFFGAVRTGEAELMAEVASLGKRALALVLKHEWGNVVEDEWDILATCSECDASHKVPPAVHVEDVDRSGWTHRPDCAWAAIVAEVKKMRDGDVDR